MNEEYLKAKAESLKAPERKIQISDEDLLCKIIEYVKQLFLVFKKINEKQMNDTIAESKIRKKKKIKLAEMEKNFVEKLTSHKDFEASELHKFVIDMRGFNGLPKVVSDEEIKLIEQDKNIFYRGADKMDYHANLLAEKSNYHYGYGIQSNGIHASNSEGVAEEYTELCENGDGILKFSLSGKGLHFNGLYDLISNIENKKVDKIVSDFENESDELKNRISLLYDAYHSLSKRMKIFVNIVLSRDLSLLGAFLGYDYIYMENKFIITILNRASMVVSESEFDRVTKGTKYEKKAGEQLGEQ